MKIRILYPDRGTFGRLRSDGGTGVSFVVSRPCPGSSRARTVFGPLVRSVGRSLLLESSRTGPPAGRFSFMLWDPSAVFRSKGARWSCAVLRPCAAGRTPGKKISGSGDPLRALKSLFPGRVFGSGSPLPFAGGVAGLFAYELKDRFERRMTPVRDPWKVPDLDLGFFDRGLALDHAKGRLCAFRAFLPSELKRLSYDEAVHETARAYQELDAVRNVAAPVRVPGGSDPVRPVRARWIGDAEAARRRFTRSVDVVRGHIRRGDVYQVNLSQVIELTFSGDPYDLYLRQAAMNPTAFAAYGDFEDHRVVSASPERLVRVEGRKVCTRPIAGTRRRSADAREDRDLTAELLLSPKERAEHVMLVDLERNDLGRVCVPGSVRVDELMAIEKYSHVKHIVSNVTGTLAPGRDVWDVIRSVFPGGTITGAPKIRAMQIIGKLERRARGPYTGSIGYVGYDGNCDLNIVIRTLWTRGRKAYLQVGAGIVADSDPQKEYEETLHKAAAFLDILGLRVPRVR